MVFGGDCSDGIGWWWLDWDGKCACWWRFRPGAGGFEVVNW